MLTRTGKAATFEIVIFGKKYTTTKKPTQIEFVRKILHLRSKSANR